MKEVHFITHPATPSCSVARLRHNHSYDLHLGHRHTKHLILCLNRPKLFEQLYTQSAKHTPRPNPYKPSDHELQQSINQPTKTKSTPATPTHKPPSRQLTIQQTINHTHTPTSMSHQSPSTRGHTARSQMTIPQFEPLPPTSLINRIINKILAPLYYLLFTIITAVIVVPVYTVIENFKNGRNGRGGQRVHRSETPGGTGGGSGERRNKAQEFLRGYSSSYGGGGGEGRRSVHGQVTGN